MEKKLAKEIKGIVDSKRGMRHRCRFLRTDKGRKGKVLYCWQTGKTIRKSECTPCLLAYIVGGLYTTPKPFKRAWRED